MNSMLIVSFVSMILINLIFFVLFERTKPKPKDILPMVVICCGASLGRVIFAVVPQVQPVTTLVIIAGSVYGCRKGYVVGALCGIISNLFLGQGPWTFFQMTGWGIIGFISGVIEKVISNFPERKKTWIYGIYSFVAAFLFSVVTDLLTVTYLGEGVNFSSALAVFATGAVFNISHGFFNFVLMMFLYGILSRKLYRIKRKN